MLYLFENDFNVVRSVFNLMGPIFEKILFIEYTCLFCENPNRCKVILKK
jgi:hypothetical protein